MREHQNIDERPAVARRFPRLWRPFEFAASLRIGGRTRLCLHNLLGRTVTAAMGLIGDRVHLQLGRVPSTGTGLLAARTIQDPSLPASFNHGQQVRSVTVRTETNQIPTMALPALDAMANTEGHGT